MPRGAALADFVTESAAERIEQDTGSLPAGPIHAPKPDPKGGLGDGGGGGEGGGCAHCSANDDAGLLGGLAALGLFGVFGLRRRRR